MKQTNEQAYKLLIRVLKKVIEKLRMIPRWKRGKKLNKSYVMPLTVCVD